MPGGQGKGAKAPTAKEFNERIEALQARLETEQAKTAEQKAIIDGQKAQLAQESARLEALRQSYHQNLTEEVAMQGQNNQVTLKSLQKELRDVYAKLVALETAIASLISGKRADPETGPPSLTANPPKKLKKEGTSVKLEGKDEQETPETLAQKQAAAALTAAQKDQVTALKSFILPHLCRFFGVLLACLDPNDVYADWIADYGFISLDNRHLRNAFEKECRPFCKKLVEIASDDEPIVVDGSSYQYKAETSSVVVGVQNESEGPRRKLLNPHIFLKVANAVHSADGEEVLEAGKIVAGLALIDGLRNKATNNRKPIEDLVQESFRSTLYPLLKSPNCLPDAFVELEGGSRTALRLSVLKNVPFDETKGKSQGNLDEKWLKDIVAKKVAEWVATAGNDAFQCLD